MTNAKKVEIPAPFSEYGKWGFKNEKGEIVIPMIYDWADPFSEGRAAVKKIGIWRKNGKWGYIDLNGNSVTPLIYHYADKFSEGRALVLRDGKYFHIDLNGNRID